MNKYIKFWLIFNSLEGMISKIFMGKKNYFSTPEKKSKSHLLINQVISKLNTRAPLETSESWDPVGLLLGDSSKKLTGIAISLDFTRETLKAALRENCNLVITHHPCYFPKNKQIQSLQPSSVLYEAIQKDIAVAAYHTNFDQCALEVPYKIAECLGVSLQGRFYGSSFEWVQLVTYVPLAAVDQVRESLCQAGAGQIGKYDFCTFNLLGEGTFRGAADTHPAYGERERLEKVPEVRLEVRLPQKLIHPVIKTLRAVHPYEEVAFNVYRLENELNPLRMPVFSSSSFSSSSLLTSQVEQDVSIKSKMGPLGYGFWGECLQEEPFEAIIQKIKALFQVSQVRITPSHHASTFSKVGYSPGKGSDFLDQVIALQCELFITGELSYHEALVGAQQGVTSIELGHAQSEIFFSSTVKSWLEEFNTKVFEITNFREQKYL